MDDHLQLNKITKFYMSNHNSLEGWRIYTHNQKM